MSLHEHAAACYKADRPETSRQAAQEVAPSAAEGCAACLEAIKAAPSTADEVAAALGWSKLYVRPRISQLRTAGLVEPADERRLNSSGKTAAVWRAAVRRTGPAVQQELL